MAKDNSKYKWYIIYTYEKRGLTGVKILRRSEIIEVQYNLDMAIGLQNFINERSEVYKNFIIESWTKLL